MIFLRRFFFNIWYFFHPPWDSGISPPELLDYIETHPAGHALDLGCGTGTNAITLARHGWQVTGVDFAQKAIKMAHHKMNQEAVQVDFRVYDVTHLQDFASTFDLVLDIGCFHNLTTAEVHTYIENLDRFLSPGGDFLLYGFFKQENASGPGLVESDIEALQKNLVLIDRQNGTERGERPSAWFTFQRRSKNKGM